MPRMMTLWAVAGSSALAGATLTYVMARTGLAPVAGRARTALRRAGSWCPGAGRNPNSAVTMHQRGAASSGNRAFDDYRIETLRKLDQDEREFRDFLERLRMAKDREQFDRFMTDRKSLPASRAVARDLNP